MNLLKFLVFIAVGFTGFCLVVFTSLRLAETLSSQTVPSKIHWERDEETLWWPLLVDVGLIWLFIAQHSAMSLPSWKQFLDDFGLTPLQRSIYVICTSAALHYLMNHWKPLPATPLWIIDTAERPLMWLFFFLLHAFCWLVVYLACLTMDFPELVGLKQVYYHLQDWNKPMSYKSQASQRLYQHMRHPGIVCLLVVFWIHPIMSLSRFFLVATWTIYLLGGFRVHEQDYVYIEQQVTRKRIRLGANL